MTTLSQKEEKSAIVLKPTLNHKENIHDLSCRQLRSLDMTLVLAAYGSLTTVNLSNNLLITLPDSFCRVMGHIQYLDLSNNRLQKLPENFGLLEKLHTLILYQNRLRTLPVSFGVLENLRWLDIAANPWSYCMRQVFGEDITQGAVVAKNTREFFFLLQNAAESCTEPGIDTGELPELEPDIKLISKRTSKNVLESFETQEELNELTLDLLTENQQVNKSFNSLEEAAKSFSDDSPITVTSGILCFFLILFTVSTITAWIKGPPKSLLNKGTMRRYDWIPSVVMDALAWMFWCTLYQLRNVIPGIAGLSEMLIIPRNSLLTTVMELMFGM